jgi:hypothetical protein
MVATVDDRRRRATPSSATGALRALDHRFTVTSNAPELCEYLGSVLRPLAAPGAPADHRYEAHVHHDRSVRLSLDGVPLSDCATVAAAVEWLLWHVNQAAAASVAGQVVLHAGGVQAGHVGILLPGPSGSGKSSLVAALVERGLRYLSDEIVVLGDGGATMAGLPRPLALRPGAQEVLARWRPAVDQEPMAGSTWFVDPGLVVPGSAGVPCPPALMVSPRFSAGSETALTELASPQALVELVGNSVRYGRPDPAHVELLAGVARRCRRYRLEFGDLDDAARTVAGLVRVP